MIADMEKGASNDYIASKYPEVSADTIRQIRSKHGLDEKRAET